MNQESSKIEPIRTREDLEKTLGHIVGAYRATHTSIVQALEGKRTDSEHAKSAIGAHEWKIIESKLLEQYLQENGIPPATTQEIIQNLVYPYCEERAKFQGVQPLNFAPLTDLIGQGIRYHTEKPRNGQESRVWLLEAAKTLAPHLPKSAKPRRR